MPTNQGGGTKWFWCDGQFGAYIAAFMSVMVSRVAVPLLGTSSSFPTSVMLDTSTDSNLGQVFPRLARVCECTHTKPNEVWGQPIRAAKFEQYISGGGKGDKARNRDIDILKPWKKYNEEIEKNPCGKLKNCEKSI